MSLKALIIDDQELICQTLAGVLHDEGWSSELAFSGTEGLHKFKELFFDLIFLDVWMDDLDGITVLQKMKETKGNVPVVIMSGHANIETAVKATRLGALDFLEKPLSIDKILPILEMIRSKHEVGAETPEVVSDQQEIIGDSDAILAIKRQIRAVAPRNSWVLITGENGTGKEIVARNLHRMSKRSEKPFVAVNCAAIPEELIESELFGYKKGAFTSAVTNKIGRFEMAHQGTLFLDEIGDMSLRTQAKILRILQEQTFERIGDTQTISVDVRVIAATNKNLQDEIRSGTFREDLFYRLNVIPIHMVPLHERSQDVPLLAKFFLEKVARELGEPTKVLSESALAVLKNYSWPGNVRELKNLIERLSVFVNEQQIEERDIQTFLNNTPGHNTKSFAGAEEFQGTLREAKSFFERNFILGRLEEHEWNISKTAESIGVERTHLHRKLRTYDIDPKKLKP